MKHYPNRRGEANMHIHQTSVLLCCNFTWNPSTTYPSEKWQYRIKMENLDTYSEMYTWNSAWCFIVGTVVNHCPSIVTWLCTTYILNFHFIKKANTLRETVHVWDLYSSDSMYKFHAFVCLTAWRTFYMQGHTRFMILDCYCGWNYSVWMWELSAKHTHFIQRRLIYQLL